MICIVTPHLDSCVEIFLEKLISSQNYFPEHICYNVSCWVLHIEVTTYYLLWIVPWPCFYFSSLHCFLDCVLLWSYHAKTSLPELLFYHFSLIVWLYVRVFSKQVVDYIPCWVLPTWTSILLRVIRPIWLSCRVISWLCLPWTPVNYSLWLSPSYTMVPTLVILSLKHVDDIIVCPCYVFCIFSIRVVQVCALFLGCLEFLLPLVVVIRVKCACVLL